MNQEEIKIECEEIFSQNKKNEERLKVLREKCSHIHTFEGNYSYRVGNIQLAEICSDCKQLIKYL